MSILIPAIEGGDPIRKNFLVFGQPEILEEDIQAVVETMRTCWLGLGPKVGELEQKFSQYQGIKHAIGLNSCTAALHLGFLSLDLMPGDEVIMPVHTFTATASQAIRCGLVPKFIDCQLKTQCIEPKLIEQAITPKTKAIVVVHFAGYPCEMNEILDICKRYNLFLLEDCAHGLESLYDGKHCGTFGDIGCFSLYSTKNITSAVGEGGLLICNDDKIEEFVRKVSLHGMSKGAHNRFSSSGFKHYDVQFPGFKYNLTDVAASMAITQLARVEENWKKRDIICNKYNDAFRSGLERLTFTPPDVPANIKHAHHLYTLHLKIEKLRVSRDFILDALACEKIGVGVHYLSLHRHSYYRNTFGLNPKDFPNAEWISDRTISLPISPKLTEQDVSDVINAVSKILNYYKK